MKKIEAVVQTFCLDEVMDALTAAGIEAAVAKNVKSFGPRTSHLSGIGEPSTPSISRQK